MSKLSSRLYLSALVVFTAGCGRDAPTAPSGMDETSIQRTLQVNYYDTLTDLQPPLNRLSIELLQLPQQLPRLDAFVVTRSDTLTPDSGGLFLDSSAVDYRPGDTLAVRLAWLPDDTLSYEMKLPELNLSGLSTRYDLRPGIDSLDFSWPVGLPMHHLWVTVVTQKTREVVASDFVQGDEMNWSFKPPAEWWGTYELTLEFTFDIVDENGVFNEANAIYQFSRRIDVYP